MQDLSSTLVLILDNMGRQKAIAALEIYREHEKFRKQLESMQDANDAADNTPAAAQVQPEEPVDDGFLQAEPKPAQPVEEEKKQ